MLTGPRIDNIDFRHSQLDRTLRLAKRAMRPSIGVLTRDLPNHEENGCPAKGSAMRQSPG